MINLTNHPYQFWSDEQKKAAKEFGPVEDMQFPNVDPEWDEDKVEALADQYLKLILDKKPQAVLCQGEMTFMYSLVRKLIENEIPVIAACSERVVITEGNVKTSVFKFVRFRRFK